MVKSKKRLVYIIIGLCLIILVLVIICYYFFVIKQNAGSDTQNNQNQTSAQELNATSANPYPFDGKYFGEADVSQGMASTGVTIKNNQVNGSAIYKGSNSSGVTEFVNGTVNAKGEITGSYTGAGSVNGQMIGVDAPYTGKVYVGKMIINYKAADSGKTVSGTITLKKD
jgi:hypothetical protein